MDTITQQHGVKKTPNQSHIVSSAVESLIISINMRSVAAAEGGDSAEMPSYKIR
jgi:hypothetical protein